jgi:late competence protein required for DNA uptake (superfamily II DNA/RNA helicase)
MICKRCEMQVYGHARANKDYCRHCLQARKVRIIETDTEYIIAEAE